MIPVVLRTARLVLDQPVAADVDDITAYCQDPLFERYLVTPWPYRREHAEGFVGDYVPGGWERDDECTWALRTAADGPLLGVVGWRAERGDVGFWLGGPHRGHGYMAEAVRAVCAWAFAETATPAILWEARVGNVASARVARAAGFRFDGEADALIPDRDGGISPAWHGSLRRGEPMAPRAGWPA